MQNTQTTPKIYVACLAAYNDGILHGRWIDANQDALSIHNEIKEMLKESPISGAEEWAIHDYEGFEGLRLSEYQDIERVAELAALIEEYGEAWVLYAENVGLDYATKESFEDAYQGQWDSEEAFAQNMAEDTMDIPPHLKYYFAFEKYARDLFTNNYFSAEGNDYKIHVFSCL